MSSMEWTSVQCFGEKDYSEDLDGGDIVTTVQFDKSGEYLAAGDKGGKIWLFQRRGQEFQYYADFQSHELEFDYLKSAEIEERINQIEWLSPNQRSLMLLSTNDKTIKLWRLGEKKSRQYVYSNNAAGNGSLQMPVLTNSSVSKKSNCRKVYANAHAYHVNSISLNSDGETFISADDLRINLWNLGINDQSFTVVDMKPELMEDLSEVITSASFHPKSCNYFMYSSSRGCIRMADMRSNALCDQHSKLFEEPDDPSNQCFFSEIMASISDARFTPDGRYIISRDYLTLKLWDINMESRPVVTISIHEYLRSRLCELYDNDYIFDKFECSSNGDGSMFITGSYNNNFLVADSTGEDRRMVEAARLPLRRNAGAASRNGASGAGANRNISPDQIDYNKKCLHVSWHPTENIIAASSLNNLFVYHGQQNT